MAFVLSSQIIHCVGSHILSTAVLVLSLHFPFLTFPETLAFFVWEVRLSWCELSRADFLLLCLRFWDPDSFLFKWLCSVLKSGFTLFGGLKLFICIAAVLVSFIDSVVQGQMLLTHLSLLDRCWGPKVAVSGGGLFLHVPISPGAQRHGWMLCTFLSLWLPAAIVEWIPFVK